MTVKHAERRFRLGAALAVGVPCASWRGVAAPHVLPGPAQPAIRGRRARPWQAVHAGHAKGATVLRRAPDWQVTQVAAVSVLLLDDAGNANQAAAFSVCIMVVVALALLLFRLVLRMSGRRNVSLIH